MTPAYEPYDDTECPRCGNKENNRDQGPYEFVPSLDLALGGPFDDCIHCIWCGRCGKPFDVAPEEYVHRLEQERATFGDLTRDLENSGRTKPDA